MTPKFSIITPTWNRAEDGRLQRCIESVQVQTFVDWEHIIVDDGSTDATELFFLTMHTELNDVIIRNPVDYISWHHQGRVIARNVGMRQARGE